MKYLSRLQEVKTIKYRIIEKQIFEQKNEVEFEVQRHKMTSFGAFVIKEVKHIFRDKRTLLVLFGIPIAQLLIFGYAVRNEISDVDIAVLDKSKDNITRELTDKLVSSPYFHLACYLDSDDEIEHIFQSGVAKQAIVFESGFADRLSREGVASIQLINDASNPNMATMMNSYSSAIIMDYAIQRFQSKQIITTEVKMLFNPELKSSNMFVPGLVTLILMLISALMTSISITREKETGSMEVLLVSPLSPAVIILGKVIPYIVLAVFNALSVLVLAIIVFGMPFVGSVGVFSLLTFLYIIAALALGLLISTVTNTQQIAMMICLIGLLLPTMLLSGFIYPIENMPSWLQYVTQIFPATYFLRAIKGVMLKGAGIEYVWKEISVLAGMTVLLILLSIAKFKTRLE